MLGCDGGSFRLSRLNLSVYLAAKSSSSFDLGT
uniref:Uncharacterized protein n=1 Tax=Arundo donax TaxID=35708 RepID=A0A0A9AMM4_ARUDO